MASLSYQEKSLYGALIADCVVFVPYFILMHTRHPTVGFIAGSIAVLIVVHIVLQSILAIATRNRLTDERDRLITLRGYRAGYFTITSLMVIGMGMLWVYTTLDQVNPTHMALHFLSVFFAVLILAEIVKTIAQILAYRRPL